jgi:ribosomal protein L11 methyltransferase
MTYVVVLGGLRYGTAEKLAAKLEQLGAVAATLDEIDETSGIWEASGYFETENAAELARAALRMDNIACVPEADWVRRSLEGLAPVAAGRFFLHGSHDRARRRAGGTSLEIDAGTAFGTGHHGTTLGCLSALDRLLKHTRPRRVLDLGCGTGVLALAAARALCRAVMASDVDPEAVRVARLNASRNGLGPRLHAIAAKGLGHPTPRRRAPFDLIFANILAGPLVALAQDLVSVLAPRGTLILSGLTRDQERWVMAAYRNRGLVPLSAIRIGSWATLRFIQKKSARRGGRPVKRPRAA